MDESVQVTRQVFDVDAANATVTLLKFASAASGVGAALTAIQGAASVLSGPISTIVGHLSGVVAIQARMEERRLSLAGQLTAYNAVGQAASNIHRGNQAAADSVTQMAHNFEIANTRASQLMQTIQEQAAALPGSAEDYLSVFDSALPAALANTQRSLSEILNASNLFAAIGVVNNQQIDMVGRDFALMMQGLAGQQVNMFRILRPLMTNRQGRQIQTGEEFNRLTGEQRFQTLQRAMERFRPLMDRFSDTWSTQVGTFESSILALKRAVSQNIFLVLRQQLGDVNAIIARLTPVMVRMGRVFETEFAQGLKTAYNLAKNVGREIMTWGTKAIMASPILQRVMGMGQMAYNRVSGFARSQANSGGMHTMLAGLGLANFSGFLSLLNHSRELGLVFNSIARIGNSLWTAFTLMWNVMSGAIAVYDQFYVTLAPLVALFGEMYAAIVEGIAWLLTGISDHISSSQFGPILADLARIAAGATAVFRIMKPYLMVLMYAIGEIAGGIISLFITLVGKGLDNLVTSMHNLKEGITLLIEKIKEWLPDDLLPAELQNNIRTNLGRFAGTEGGSVGTQSDILDRVRSIFNHTAESARAAATDSARTRQNQQRPHTNNDFRYSRFDITQKFAEGFDPDRIAAVFARDLEGLAEQRTSSQGFNPAFTV